MTSPLPITLPFRVADLPTRKPQRFDLRPGPADLAALAGYLDVTALRKLRFKGEIRPSGRGDHVLEALLGATVVQPCVVTLAPVTTRIEEPVLRRYLAEMPEPTGDEVEMPEDDSVEALPPVIDAAAVMVEALVLALPLFPRADDAELGALEAAPPGAAPLKDETVRPFAGLAGLRDTLAARSRKDDDDTR